MRDSFGDGIIKPDGYYTFKVDDVILATSDDDVDGDFDYSESVLFGDDCEGYTSPTDSPTSTPSSRPTYGPCGDDDMEVELEIQTDDWAYETSWDIIDTTSGNELAGANGYSDFTSYNYKYCFPSDMCLRFEMRDSFGDGIIQPDGYTLKVDDIILATSDDDVSGDFDYSESVTFGGRDIDGSFLLARAEAKIETLTAEEKRDDKILQQLFDEFIEGYRMLKQHEVWVPGDDNLEKVEVPLCMYQNFHEWVQDI